MTDIVGTLRLARRIPVGQDVRAPCLAGHVYGDTKGRFRDGDYITTSTIATEDGDVFKTRYSAYRVESWADGTQTFAAREAANDNVDHRERNEAVARAYQINEMVAHFHGKSKAAGWWEENGEDLTGNKYVHAAKLMLCVSELAEAMEGLRKGLMDDKLPHRKMAEVELADAVIRIFDLAGVLGYDLGGAVVEKSAYNTVRPDHQPGNRMIAGGKAY